MNSLRQFVTVFAIGISTLSQRLGTSLVIVAGVACVAAVLVSMLSVAAGQTRMYRAGDGIDQAIVLPKEAGSEGTPGLTREMIATVLNAPGIARGADGAPIADAELVLSIMPPPGIFLDSLHIRGIGARGTQIRADFQLESGRMFRTGAQELVIGVGAAKVFGLGTGDTVLMPGGFWPIVGMFSSGGDRTEGHFLADAETLMSAVQRAAFSSVIVKLASRESFAELRQWLITNPTLAVDVERVSDYLFRTSGAQLAFFTRATYVIGVIMALGALFGATKIMFAAVRARTREIGTLRALGFGSAPVAASVLLEAILLALIGAVFGTFMAWIVFDGRVVYSGSVFRLHVSFPLAALGLAWAVVIALLGALFPALRAAKLFAAHALRAQ
jgi:putative ABC transport system permease protein